MVKRIFVKDENRFMNSTLIQLELGLIGLEDKNNS